jgi:thymidylate synthase (FAD)
MRQWVRHRTQSLNEYSGRYSKMIEEYYIPENFKYQSEDNHQGSSGPLPEIENNEIRSKTIENSEKSHGLYNKLLEAKVSKEQARIVLPINQYTEFYTTMNLWNLFHLLHLRLHKHTQCETQQFAIAIFELLKKEDKIKWSMEIFSEKNELDYLYLDAISKCKDLSKLKEYLGKFE